MSSVRFGKHPPKIDYRTLLYKNYTGTALAPPATADTLARVYAKLGIHDPTVLFPMDGNDRLGDCTIAALAHAITTYRGLSGKKSIMTTNAVVKIYFHLSHGLDSGLNELDVLNYWQSTPVSHDKIVAYVRINPKNHAHVQQAIALFGAVYLGFQVQENCEKDFNNREPWTPGRLTTDGHAVLAVAYDKNELTVLTWGNTQKATWAWWDECVDEAYAILPPEAHTDGWAPGFNFDQLAADLQAVAG